MEFQKNDEFDNYIDCYKKLPLVEKKNHVINEIHTLLALLEKINTGTSGYDYKLLYNREILDVGKDSSSEEDFVEAIFVYIHIIQEAIADYIDKIGG